MRRRSPVVAVVRVVLVGETERREQDVVDLRLRVLLDRRLDGSSPAKLKVETETFFYQKILGLERFLAWTLSTDSGLRLG